MDHVSNYPEVLHPTDLHLTHSQNVFDAPMPIIIKGRELENLYRDRAMQEKSCPLIKVEQNKSLETLSMGQSCRGQIGTVTLYFGPGLCQNGYHGKRTQMTQHLAPRALSETENRLGSTFSHQVQGHLSRRVATVLPELSTLFPNPIVQVLYSFKDGGSQNIINSDLES